MSEGPSPEIKIPPTAITSTLTPELKRRAAEAAVHTLGGQTPAERKTAQDEFQSKVVSQLDELDQNVVGDAHGIIRDAKERIAGK